MEALEERTEFSTFRDPAGSVEIRRDGVYRRVQPPHHLEILDFLESALCLQLVEDGRLIDSEMLAAQLGDEPLLLRHSLVNFRSYPWEWPPRMWFSAAELTLNLCRDLVRQGWILKDATPLNVLFRGTSPVFVDILSVSRADLSEPVWYAYAQFVRTFLLPLLAYSSLGWPLQASLLRRDGYEPEELFDALPWRTRLRQPALSAVTLPRWMNKRASTGRASSGGEKSIASSRFGRDPEVVQQILQRTLSTLLVRTKAVTPEPHHSIWSNYAETATHYSLDEHAAKRDFAARVLEIARPARVLDVGCNTGAYSLLAADAGAQVVAIDTDMRTVDRLCIALQGLGKNILPLCVDISRPTPAVGWQNRESAAFLDRCSGHFDMVMMLAVLHHLLFANQVPLDQVAALCNDLTTRHLVVEWVPLSDLKSREIARGREPLYSHVTEAAFRVAFARYFSLVREVTLPNGRVLCHFQKS